jgi:hypothetical protein
MRAIFHPEAHEEMVQSARFYEKKAEGLGAVFLQPSKSRPAASSKHPKRGQLIGQTFASDWCLDFPSRSSTKYSLIESSSPP